MCKGKDMNWSLMMLQVAETSGEGYARQKEYPETERILDSWAGT